MNVYRELTIALELSTEPRQYFLIIVVAASPGMMFSLSLCTYTCVYVCVCMHACMYACVSVCVYVCMYVLYVCMYVCMYACMYVCMRIMMVLAVSHAEIFSCMCVLRYI
jgi:hypothetical protein